MFACFITLLIMQRGLSFTCNVLGLNRQKGVESIELNHGSQKNRGMFIWDNMLPKQSFFIILIKRSQESSSPSIHWQTS